MSKKLQVPELSTDAAGKLLVNVFESCDVQPSNLPIETLTSYSEYRRERFSLQKYILLIVFVVFLILPLFFIAPKLSLTLKSFDDYPTYELAVDSAFIPVSRVSAAVDGKPVSVYENDARVFSITPTENGTLNVHVTLSNRQYNVVDTVVEDIDVQSPVFLGSSKGDDTLTLFVSETGSGLNPDNIYCITVSGEIIRPVSIDLEGQSVVFPFPDESFTVFISDLKENTLQLVVTVAGKSDGSSAG